MRIQFKVTGKNFDSLINDMDTKRHSALTLAGTQLEKDVKSKLSNQGGGRRYKISGTKKTYRASAPYQPPAKRLGHLGRMYKFEMEGSGENMSAVVGNPLEYAIYLEYGTYKMAMRPHLRKTAHENLDKYQKLITRIFKK